ncbi:DUF3611 family protein [Thermosynechococcus sp. GLH187]|uniref:DUF3611 family protein n=1 Tax=unclassified Thermosynechococcus TaxID=2622553 RepID=UPI002856746B|nr:MULTISPECIES: DUF3611 family protein [unclassified Thermosynechococcus]MDR5639903.1 DUF3611 family protein [Thermosynechococcus sp. PP42]WNC21824.1 DUF3611 family protein [Thermosynechococcus sp. PP22]WNC44682.1 DUF3611 family protein [Thermosynechococcus sp. GLH187]WNC47218.1 DUF3611 family protein [Thermosynechococcus sp. GLH333]WNC49755.1 DUF3611 family protein [Thermosynechococcus sp. GLH87]
MERLPSNAPPPSHRSTTQPLHRLGRELQRFGWIGFWTQVVLGFVSLLIIIIVIFSRQFNINRPQNGMNSPTLGLVLAIIGLVFLGVSIYCCYRYPQLGQRLDRPEKRPTKEHVIRSLNIGLWVNIAGMIFTVAAAEWNVGMLLLKVLSIPQGAAVYATNVLIEPLEIFVIQAKVNTIAAQLTGIIVALWLLRCVRRPL